VNRYPGLSDADIAAVRELAERQLTREEFTAYVSAPCSPEERAEHDEMIAWFTRRYPTPAQRLAWARRAWRRWGRAAGADGRR
jgi:hypothetical protein